MNAKPLNIKPLSVAKLLSRIDEGRFAIPRLQREFVWDGSKAAKLFDSIMRHMPIGVVTVWETPRSQRLYLRQKYHVLPHFNPRNSKVWFLIDGQQRVSVLHLVAEGAEIRNALHKTINFRRVVLSLDGRSSELEIIYRKPRPGLYESLSDILHPHWRRRLSHLGKQDLARVANCRRRILSYPMQLMFIRSSLDGIRETFLRINTQGMKIKTADAIFAQAEDLELRDVRHEVADQVDPSFGSIPEMPILFAMAAVRGAKEARGEALRAAIERLGREAKQDPRLRKALAKDWHRLSVCFGKAVDYLRDNFAVVTRDYLYSDYMIAVLALFFFWNGRGTNHRQKEQIRRWFWATSVGSRYSGAKFLRCIPTDLKFFRKLASQKTARFTYSAEVDRLDVRKALYASRTGITAAFYSMLLLRKPVSILDDGLNGIPMEKYSAPANRKERHHIFPKGVVAGLGFPSSLYNSICNICLQTAEENQKIGPRRPHIYLREAKETGGYFRRKMERHLIPAGDKSGVWQRNVSSGFKRMISERNDLICKEFEKLAGAKLFRKHF